VPTTSSVSPNASKFFPGTPVKLSCTFSGVPNPSLAWYKDTSILANGVDDVSIINGLNNSTLTVLDSTGEEGGYYNCIANNIAGSSSNNFHIQCKFCYYCMIKHRDDVTTV